MNTLTTKTTKYSSNFKKTYELKGELKFKTVIKEYLDIFGGLNAQGLGRGAFRAIDLAQYHLGLTDDYTNCFYINNFILNQKYIIHNFNKSYEIISYLIQKRDFNQLSQMISSIAVIREYFQSAYLYCQTKEDVQLDKLSKDNINDYNCLLIYSNQILKKEEKGHTKK